MKTELNKLSPLARRDFIMRTAQTALGVTVMPALNLRAAAAAPGAGYRQGQERDLPLDERRHDPHRHLGSKNR
jgi:hypothetical protein